MLLHNCSSTIKGMATKFYSQFNVINTRKMMFHFLENDIIPKKSSRRNFQNPVSFCSQKPFSFADINKFFKIIT